MRIKVRHWRNGSRRLNARLCSIGMSNVHQIPSFARLRWQCLSVGENHFDGGTVRHLHFDNIFTFINVVFWTEGRRIEKPPELRQSRRSPVRGQVVQEYIPHQTRTDGEGVGRRVFFFIFSSVVIRREGRRDQSLELFVLLER